MPFPILSLLNRLVWRVLGISTPQHYPPPLPAEEEYQLFLLKMKGDEDARQKLILHNLRLVTHIVRKYYASSRNQEDLISIGSLGLIKAVDTFDPEKGARFATYGAKCIQNEILMHFRAQRKTANDVSIHETIDVDRDGNPLTYMDVISSDEDMTEEIDNLLLTRRAMRYVETLLEERERRIIVLRYGLNGETPLTQREVADLLGISRSYVSRIEKGALDKLSSALGRPQ